ncbi:MAG TPA: OmpA family protein [Candidatus Aquilonibacter sp.]|nr:OmpA family protein [Candidatus Aquilonibacter sp.]
MRRFGYLLTLVLAIALGATTGFAQNGKLKIKVTPKQAYVFVDGNAIREGSQSISLPSGQHTVTVANYGYKMDTENVNIQAGKTTPLDVKLTQEGGNVSGPFGDVELKGDERAAVLSNGTTPGYFVGHVDEFNFDWLFWHQNLLLPPGTHHLTVTHNGKTVWSGDVNVEADKKVIVDLATGKTQTVNWPRAEKLKEVPRFKVGIASAQVAVAPVTGTFSVTPSQINCGQSATLNWQSAETVDANISNVGKVDASGNQSVSPHATTTYDFSATGPGGTVKGTGTVNVNTTVTASLTANPTEVKYRKIGEKVLTNDSSTLSWQTGNADNITLDGNKVDASGSQTVTPTPTDTSEVPEGQPARTIDESKSYTLNATNVCGGSSTQTASIHITGTVEPIPTVLLQSIFYPTDYPDKKNPDVGLVKSQQDELTTLATGFKKYLEYDPDAKLSIEAHADVRGSRPFNQDLSERRVERIKAFLVDQGISADKIQTAAYGKDQELDRDTVKGLEQQNPNPAPKAHARNARGQWLAYNRRADIILLPSAKKSTQYFPNNAADADLIWQVPKPSLKKVEAADQ